MDIFTTSITNPGIKTNIISVLKRIHKNVADLSQYRPIARLSKGLNTLVNVKTKYQKKCKNMKKQMAGSKLMDIITTSVMNPGQGTNTMFVIKLIAP
jgi:hypothetical protein